MLIAHLLFLNSCIILLLKLIVIEELARVIVPESSPGETGSLLSDGFA